MRLPESPRRAALGGRGEEKVRERKGRGRERGSKGGGGREGGREGGRGSEEKQMVRQRFLTLIA